VQNVFTTSQDIGTTLLASWSTVTNASNYAFQYRIFGSSGSWIGASTSANSIKLNNLNSGGHYEYRLRAYNASGTPVSAIQTGDFTTSSFVFSKDMDMGTTCKISWPDCNTWASTYIFQYMKKYGGTSWINISCLNPNSKLNNLIPDTTYLIRVVVNKGGGLWGTSRTGEFKADSYSSNVTNKTSTSLDLNWTSFNTGDPAPWVVDQYLKYRVFGSTSNWTQKYIPAAGNTTNLTGLTANTDYEFQIHVYLPTFWGVTPLGFFDTKGVKSMGTDNVNNDNNIQIYPNPFIDQFSMDLFAVEETKINWKIFDMTGKVVLSKSENINSGYSSINISAGHLPLGVYMLNVMLNDQMYNFRILKQ
jgi:hypothetical protein